MLQLSCVKILLKLKLIMTMNYLTQYNINIYFFENFLALPEKRNNES
jgi:hypothetical protein